MEPHVTYSLEKSLLERKRKLFCSQARHPEERLTVSQSVRQAGKQSVRQAVSQQAGTQAGRNAQFGFFQSQTIATNSGEPLVNRNNQLSSGETLAHHSAWQLFDFRPATASTSRSVVELFFT